MKILQLPLLLFMGDVVDGVLASSAVGLYTARTDNPQDPGDLTMATDIANISVSSWGDARIFSNGSCGYNFVAEFEGSDSDANVALGYALFSTVGSFTYLIGYEDFANPIALPDSTAQVVISIPVSLNPNSDYGHATLS